MSDPANMPTSTPRLVYLDVLRCVAILMVFGPHTWFRLPDRSEVIGWHFFQMWRAGGWVGVDLFFVLSGFLIGGLLFAEQRKHRSIRFGRFFIRRTFKIWPSYLVFLTLGFFWAIRYMPDPNTPPLTVREAASGMWPYLIHIQNYRETPMIDSIGHAWSLAVEEHFYILLPVVLIGLAWVWRRRHPSERSDPAHAFRAVPWIGAGLLIACLALRIYSWRGNAEFNEFRNHWPTHLRIDALFTGVVLAYAVHFARPVIESLRPWRWLILAFGIACFVPFAWIGGKWEGACTFGYTALSLGSAALVLAAWYTNVPPVPSPAVFGARNPAGGGTGGTTVWLPAATPPFILRGVDATARVLAFIGARSYSIYLFHMPFTKPLTDKLLSHLGMWHSHWHYALAMAVYSGVAIGLGSIMYFVIEAPSVALREKLFPSRSSAAQGEKSGPMVRPLREVPALSADAVSS